LADCDPDPLTVAIWMLKSLTILPCEACCCVSGLTDVPPAAPAASATFSVAMSCTPPDKTLEFHEPNHDTTITLTPVDRFAAEEECLVCPY
jgi:hypothetical protein